MDFINGERYRLTLKRDQDRTQKTAVMDYLGEEPSVYLFSLRPRFGTQTVPKRWVRQAEHVTKDVPLEVMK